MQADLSTSRDIAHVIQLSVAPVFLLSGIGAMLAVMTNRLARIVDRARGHESERGRAETGRHAAIDERLSVLSKRAKLINRAITLCTVTALLVCTVVVTLFLGAFLEFDASIPVATFFVGAMITFFGGLLSFLREIAVATRALRIGAQ